MISAATEAGRMDSPRATIAPVTSNTEDSRTINCPGPNPCGRCRVPALPPTALAQPPRVVNHGSQALTDPAAAKSATTQPGCGRGIAPTVAANPPATRD